ncbi:MAG: VWA domain-containing protein [Chloroflexaceae bacterium]|nr:VWA domain-containing protein [Chloroflexaceae bacterium]
MTCSAIELQAFPSRSILPASDNPQLVYVMVVASPQGLPVSVPRLPLNLCLVIDRSSSMRGDRMFQVKEAAGRILDRLGAEDYFSLVTFNDRAHTVIPTQRVGTNAGLLKNLMNDLEAEGGTEMATGLELAVQEVQRAFLMHSMTRIIILTDGRTYGDEGQCVKIARKAQQKGIGLTALGIGHEWNEDLLEIMTASENSHSRYITSVQDIPEVFDDELRRMHSIFARGVQLLIETHSDSTVRSLDRIQPFIAPIPFKGEHDLRWVGNLGDWPGAEVQSFLMELVVPPLTEGDYHLLRLVLRFDLPIRDATNQRCELDLNVAVRPAHTVSNEVDLTVKHWLERLVAYRLQDRAWKNLQTGSIDEAVMQLQMAGTRLLEAGEDELARTIREEVTRLLKLGTTTAEGRKRIKYGTRGLIKAPNR